jgi:hypothetical protein
MCNNLIYPKAIYEEEFNALYEKEASAKEIKIEKYYDKIIAEYLRTTKL